MNPYFRCMQCGAVQLMYLAGGAPPQAQGQLVAPVVQAPQHAGESDVKHLLIEFATAVVKGAGDQVGQQAMAAWT
ncbi:MAG TPA: hypothetical protein VLD13_03525 [Gaiellaceae bacterium]|nr:hypothetical protein [Gaiellaceae bacterium]